jgi:hypothetical protein
MSIVQRLVRLAAITVLTLVFVWLFSSTTATATQRLVMCSPVPTQEPMSVEPVTSPTTLLTQTLYVRLGNGRRVTVTSEAGTNTFTRIFTATFLSPLTIPLSRNVTHHVTVVGQVDYQGTGGCTYTYIMTRTLDKNNAPLKIIQLGRRILLPIILKH